MKRGFILMEFVTAIAIIAILAAILFPVFARAREKSRQCSCLHNLYNVGVSLRHYAADYHGHFPPSDNDLSPLLYQYLPDARALDCPTVTQDFDGKAGEYSYKGGYQDDDRGDLILMADRAFEAHNGGNNCLHVDGHAKWMKRDSKSESPDFRLMPGLQKSPPPAPSSPPPGGAQ